MGYYTSPLPHSALAVCFVLRCRSKLARSLQAVLAVNAAPPSLRFAGLAAAESDISLAHVCEMDLGTGPLQR